MDNRSPDHPTASSPGKAAHAADGRHIQAALLDLDGTLVDSVPDLARAANAMREELRLPPLDTALIATFVGTGMDNLIRRALAGKRAMPDDESPLFAQARDSFRRHYRRINGEHSVVYAGVAPGLRAMHARGLRLAVVTNKPAEFTAPLLKRMGLADFFSIVVCGDTCARKKPEPDPVLHACAQLGIRPEQAVMIGDSINDALAGRAAGCKTLAVPYGYNEGQDARGLDVDALVPTLIEADAEIARWNAAVV